MLTNKELDKKVKFLNKQFKKLFKSKDVVGRLNDDDPMRFLEFKIKVPEDKTIEIDMGYDVECEVDAAFPGCEVVDIDINDEDFDDDRMILVTVSIESEEEELPEDAE